MNGPLKLAWKYILFHKLKSVILIACIVLSALLPISVKILLWQFNDKLVSRADSTPAVIGAKGSDLDLTLNTLYFKTDAVDPIPYSDVTKIRESNLAQAIPIHALYTARDYPVVGTSLEYFDFRSMSPSSGTLFATLGECVIGCKVAQALGVGTGDHLISDRDNIVNLAGQSPLRLSVVGVLGESFSPDDSAVFVDLKTAWVIEGLGHGHQDVTQLDDDSGKILSRSEQRVVANEGVASYLEITPENIESFHFHGDTEEFPITSIIVIADNVKNETLLQGRIDAGAVPIQFAKPGDVIRKLMALVFRVKQVLDANAILVAVSTAMLLVLVVLLSLRLRQREMETMFKLGCTRGTIVLLQVAEMGIIFGIAVVMLSLAVWGVWLLSGNFVESLLVNSQ
jgi:putative ABC transport system permease protein